MFHEPIENFPVVHVSFHLDHQLRDHYNSVRKIEDDLTPNRIPINEVPIGHDEQFLENYYILQG